MDRRKPKWVGSRNVEIHGGPLRIQYRFNRRVRRSDSLIFARGIVLTNTRIQNSIEILAGEVV